MNSDDPPSDGRHVSVLERVRRMPSAIKLAAALQLVPTGGGLYFFGSPFALHRAVAEYVFDQDCGRTDSAALKRAGALLERPRNHPYSGFWPYKIGALLLNFTANSPAAKPAATV